jgi:hypothetical protein
VAAEAGVWKATMAGNAAQTSTAIAISDLLTVEEADFTWCSLGS